MTSPEIETEYPKSSDPVSDATSFAAWVHSPPLRAKTYAEPSLYAPTTMVPPEVETEHPKKSYDAASDAVNLAVWVHVVVFRAKVYVDPT